MMELIANLSYRHNEQDNSHYKKYSKKKSLSGVGKLYIHIGQGVELTDNQKETTFSLVSTQKKIKSWLFPATASRVETSFYLNNRPKHV